MSVNKYCHGRHLSLKTQGNICHLIFFGLKQTKSVFEPSLQGNEKSHLTLVLRASFLYLLMFYQTMLSGKSGKLLAFSLQWSHGHYNVCVTQFRWPAWFPSFLRVGVKVSFHTIFSTDYKFLTRELHGCSQVLVFRDRVSPVPHIDLSSLQFFIPPQKSNPSFPPGSGEAQPCPPNLSLFPPYPRTTFYTNTL